LIFAAQKGTLRLFGRSNAFEQLFGVLKMKKECRLNEVEGEGGGRVGEKSRSTELFEGSKCFGRIGPVACRKSFDGQNANEQGDGDDEDDELEAAFVKLRWWS